MFSREMTVKAENHTHHSCWFLSLPFDGRWEMIPSSSEPPGGLAGDLDVKIFQKSHDFTLEGYPQATGAKKFMVPY
jgi:hypothetical protein